MAKRIEDGECKATHEEIARKAHAIYEASGRLPGHDLDNWLEAETELQAARKRSGSARFENRETAAPAPPPARPVSEVSSRTGS
jgi:hypothetical protein